MKLSRLKPHAGLLVILLLYLTITGYTSWRVALGDGPDEMAHFMFARFLHKERFLPFTPEEREAAGYKSDQPPLNAAFVASAFFWGDLTKPPFVKLTYNTPRRFLVRQGRLDSQNVNAPQVIRTEDPLAGEILFWRFGRLLSILVSGATLIGIYCLALKFFAGLPQKNLWALAAVMSVAFIPTFTFISGVFSYESLVGLWLALYLLVAFSIFAKTEVNWLYLVAGLLIGLAIVTKLSALPAPLSLIMLVLMAGYRTGWSKRQYVTRLALSLLGVLLGAGWWFALIEVKFNRVAELGWMAGLIQPILGDGSDTASREVAYILSDGQIGGRVQFAQQAGLLDWATYLFQTFWALRFKGPDFLVLIMLVVVSLVLLGLIRVWRQQGLARPEFAFLVGHAALFLILPLVRFLTTQLVTVAGQGHHLLFPAVGVFALLMTRGLGAWLPNRIGRPWIPGMVLGVGLLLWSLLQAIQINHSPPVPVRTVPPVMPASATKLGVDFGSMTLKGYELKGLNDELECCDATHPALGLYLYWLANEFAPEDYLTQLSLVDQQGETQSIWVSHAANGRYPTRAWEAGDIVRDELWLPLIGLKPGVYTMKLELWGGHAALAAKDGASSFTLTTVDLPQTPLVTNSLAQAENEPAFQIWQAGQIVNGVPEFYSRSTIQITTASAVDLSLVGPDQIARHPVKKAGRTRIFVVDPLWSNGPYQVVATVDDQPTWSFPDALTIRLRERQTTIPASQTTIQANFANQLMLLGYNLPQRHVMPGEQLPLVLHWQALQTLPADFIMFTRLRDQAGQVWGGYDRWPVEYYSPLLWAAGEVVEDGFTIQVKPEAPPGLYYLDVGFYLPVGEAAVSLPLVQDGKMSEVTSVTIGPFKVGHIAPAGLTIDTPKPQVSLDQSFGDGPDLTLLGYDLSSQVNQPDPALQLTLYWRTEAPLLVDYTVFVHLRNAAGEIMAQKDQLPLNGAYPTSLWTPGEMIADKITMPVPATLPAGEYKVVIGLYDLQTGQRLAVPGHPANEVTLVDTGFKP